QTLFFNGLFEDYIGLTEAYYFWVYFGSLPGAAVMVYLLMVLKWEDRLKNYVFVSVGSLLVMLSFALYFTWFNRRLETLVLAYLVNSVWGLFMGGILLKEFFVKPTLSCVKEIASGLLPIFIASIALNVTPFIERKVISSVSNFESVAIFSSVVVLIRLMRFPIDSYYTAWQPLYSNSFDDKNVLDRLLNRVLLIHLLWKFIAFLIIYYFGIDLVLFVFKGKILVDIKTILAISMAYSLDFSLGIYGFKYMIEKRNILMIIGNTIPLIVLFVSSFFVESDFVQIYAFCLAGFRLFWLGFLAYNERGIKYWLVSLVIFISIILL
ncbi:MAG: hypothetical protein P8N00_05530, partial [Flavobacteriales bacterium]|nr:hypothetical protein [Flavobacteriales bacterium]